MRDFSILLPTVAWLLAALPAVADEITVTYDLSGTIWFSIIGVSPSFMPASGTATVRYNANVVATTTAPTAPTTALILPGPATILTLQFSGPWSGTYPWGAPSAMVVGGQISFAILPSIAGVLTPTRYQLQITSMQSVLRMHHTATPTGYSSSFWGTVASPPNQITGPNLYTPSNLQSNFGGVLRYFADLLNGTATFSGAEVGRTYHDSDPIAAVPASSRIATMALGIVLLGAGGLAARSRSPRRRTR
jgi:hypothetical protein